MGLILYWYQTGNKTCYTEHNANEDSMELILEGLEMQKRNIPNRAQEANE